MAHLSEPEASNSALVLPDADHQQLSAARWLRLAAPTAGDDASADRSHGCSSALWKRVRALIESELTERQRQVLELYYLRGLDQATVAKLLGISQQSVSEHLFGKLRNGHHVGGLVRKLQKLCAERGIAPARHAAPSDAVAISSCAG